MVSAERVAQNDQVQVDRAGRSLSFELIATGRMSPSSRGLDKALWFLEAHAQE
jgi:hypothetical protein